MHLRQTLAVVLLLSAGGAACSAILDLQPPSPPAGLAIDAAPLSDQATPDGGAEVCAPLMTLAADAGGVASTYYALQPGAAQDGATGWEFFDTSAVNKAPGFAGGTFDGRYVYFAPYESATVTRFDTTGDFQDSGAWSTFAVGAISAAPTSFSGAVFDGRYVYFVPRSTGPNGILARYDSLSDGGFASALSWATFDTSVLAVDGGPATVGFSGAVFDGRYVYLVPTNDGDAGPDGRVVRYDTTAPDGGARGDAATEADSGGSGLSDLALWSTFDTLTTQVDGGAPPIGFAGGVFDGKSVYFAPHLNGGPVNGGYSAMAVSLKMASSFTALSSWSSIDLTTVNGEAFGFWGAAFDGRFVYLVPNAMGIVVRYDTQAGGFGSESSWSAYDLGRIVQFDGGRLVYAGAAFDGRFVYFVPGSAGFGIVTRYDTLSTFTADCAWSTANLSQTDADASSIAYLGAVFDGQHVYLVPKTGGGLVARFTAKSPASMPSLPGFYGSFY